MKTLKQQIEEIERSVRMQTIPIELEIAGSYLRARAEYETTGTYLFIKWLKEKMRQMSKIGSLIVTKKVKAK